MIQTKYFQKITPELHCYTSLLAQRDVFISSAMGKYSEGKSDSFVQL
jgi:hypothetical protein